MSRGLAAGIDVGGTDTKLVAAASSGRVLASLELPTEERRGPREFVRRLAAGVRGLERRLGRFLAVGVGAAGDIDSRRGLVRYSPNLKSFSGFPLRDALKAALRRPVTVHNDANMAAWGGYAVELGRRYPSVFCVTLGTGIGGGVILGGRLYEGATGSAGELGHTRLRPGGRLCGCGARGCLEAYAGARGLLRTARAIYRRNPAGRGRLKALLRRGPWTPRELAAAARRGDACAREAWRRAASELAVGIANLVYLFNPDAVLLAGGMSRAGPLILPPIRRALAVEPFRAPFRHVQLRIARAPRLGALGAALFALESGR